MNIAAFALGALSRFLRPFVDITGKTQLFAYGDSYTAGQNATTAAERYINQFATGKGLTLTNRAVGGRGVYVAASTIQGDSFSRPATVITVMAGLNDIRRNGSATKTLKKIEACYRAIMLRCISNLNTPSGHSSVVRSGSVLGYAANTVGGLYPTGTLPGNFASYAPSGSASSWTWTFTGTGFGIQFSASDDVISNYGTGKIKIDGVVVKTIDLGEWYDGISDGANDNARGPLGLTFHNLANTSHTIVVESDGNGNFPVDFFCTLQAPSGSPAILFAEIPYLNSTGYALSPNMGSVAVSDIASTVIKSIVNEYIALGFNVGFVQTNSYTNLITDLDTDNIHWNNLGHDHGTNAFNAAVL